MGAHPEISSYDYQGKQERCLMMEPGQHRNADLQLCLIPPLFGEANRMRRLMVSIMRHLADTHHISCVLPDLPGTMESEAPLSRLSFADWQQALAQFATQSGPVTHSAAFRAGAALDQVFADALHWRLSPAAPAQQLRTLARTQLVTMRDAGATPPSLSDMLDDGCRNGLTLAGYTLSAKMVDALANTSKVPGKADRIVRLAGDGKAANAYLDGPPLWLRAEPGDAPELAAAIAANIANWMAG